MKYYADYYNERVYSVSPNGDTVCKLQDILTEEISTVKFKSANDDPWIVDENSGGVFFEVEPISAEDFNQFGIKWRFGAYADLGFCVPEYWRNYKVGC